MLHRKIRDHWIWKSDHRFKWWIDVLLSVNHCDNKVLIKGTLIECKRGQSVMSLDTWAKRWNVTKKTVKDFFELLQKDSMLVYEGMQNTTRITVCNYDSYQGMVNDTETQSKRQVNATETLTAPKQELKEGNNDINISFDVFWEAYGKKVDRVKCERKWKGLTNAEREACITAVPVYIQSTPDKKFRKNPATYLNNKSWTNEIITKPSTSQARAYVPPKTPSYINPNYVQPV